MIDLKLNLQLMLQYLGKCEKNVVESVDAKSDIRILRKITIACADYFLLFFASVHVFYFSPTGRQQSIGKLISDSTFK